MSPQLHFDMRDALSELRNDPDTRVLVLTGKGTAFCAGQDLKQYFYKGWQDALLRSAANDASSQWRDKLLRLFPKPTIAAINGDALGHGLELALACDLRLAVRGARLGLGHVLQGAMPWDGGTQRLPRLAPRALALEMVLTGRVIEAAEAWSAGLVLEPQPSRGELASQAEALAGKLASVAPIAARYVKEAARKGMEVPLEHGLRLEADLALLLHTSQDRAEGIRAFMEKRSPRFTGR